MIRFAPLFFFAFASSAPAIERFAPEEVLFSLRSGAGKTAVADLLDVWQRRYGLLAVEELFEKMPKGLGKPAQTSGLGQWYRLQLPAKLDPEQVAKELLRWPQVEYAQPNYLRREAAADSLFAAQWNLVDMGWQNVTPGDLGPVVVAIVDSGMDYTHPDLVGQLWLNRAEDEGIPGVDDDGNGYIDDRIGWDFSDAPGLTGTGDYLEPDADPFDESGHGTHVAGIVAAVAGNGIGIAGIAPAVRLMVLRAGFNLSDGGYLQDDDTAAALVYAADNGALVVNMSWGDPQPSPVIEAAVRYAAERGLVLVAAAGNEGTSDIFYPARSEWTIAVGATAPGGGVLTFSNYGPSLDIAAPGHAIWSLLPGGGYIERSGTSMASAHVAGLAGQVLARQPQWTSAEVRGALAVSARDVGPVGWDSFSGAGLAHFAALEVENPPSLQIRNPPGGMANIGKISIDLALLGVEQYELSWGLGEIEPRRWNLIEAGAIPTEEIRVSWDTGDLVDGAYLLRLRGWVGGGWLEERVELQLVSEGPEAKAARVVRALQGPYWSDAVEWQTDLPAAGTVFLQQQDQIRYQLAAPPARKKQRVELPLDLPAGRYDVWVRAGAAGQAGPRVPVGTVETFANRVDRWAFNLKVVLPDGYLMPELSDFNGDGISEVVQMGYGGGLQYNTGDFYQYRAGAAERIFNTLQLFIPWGVQDGDGDGLLELMAVDALRVRLFETPSPVAFPDRLVWEWRDVWGGESADLDGDGLPEFFLRSSTGPFFQVYESVADNQYEEIAVLANPTTGSNGLGQRQVVGDMDGDGRGELLSGDDDGDVFVYERVADDAYRSGWQQAGDGDVRIVGGGLDLDGDGAGEFAVARFFNDPFDVEARRWQVDVYGATGDNAYASEWQVEVLGGQSGGSGIGLGDLDGDGDLEWVLLTVPNLYVFRATEAGAYEPVWHNKVRETHRPLIGDVDGDGAVDLVFNGDGQVEIFSLDVEGAAVERPAGFVAYSLGDDAIGLEWQPVAGATGYKILRDGEVVVDRHDGLSYIDDGLSLGASHSYRVAALGGDGVVGPFTVERSAKVFPAPELKSLQRISTFQLALEFSAEMEEPLAYRFRLEPDLGPVVAAVADRGGERIVLAFAETLPDSGRYTLSITGLRSESGGALADPSFSFVLNALSNSARPLRAEVLSATRVAIQFDKPIPARDGLQRAFAFIDTSLQIAGVQVDGDRIVLQLASPLRPVGRSYGINITGLIDDEGLLVEGALSFRYAASDLSAAKPFPNPYRPLFGELTFAFLTPAAAVAVFDASGQLVRSLVERDGDGGVLWDGRNQAGQLVGSGIYLYRITDGKEVRLGKLAVLRD